MKLIPWKDEAKGPTPDGLKTMLQDLIEHAESDYADRDQRFESVRRHFLKMRLRAWQKHLNVKGLYVRASSFSRVNSTENEWLQEGTTLDQSLLNHSLAAIDRKQASIRIGTEIYQDNHHFFFMPLRRKPDIQGYKNKSFIAALLDKRTQPGNIHTELLAFAEEVDLCLRSMRQWADHVATSEMSHRLTLARDHKTMLTDLARILRVHTRSDGVKVYILRNGCEGPEIEKQCWTATSELVPKRYSLDAQTGMADWVLDQNRWLLVHTTSGPKAVGELCSKALSVDVKGELIEETITARPEKSGVTQDRESSLFLYPLSIQDRVIGVLSIWRLGDWEAYPEGPFFDAYDHLLDLPFLREVSSVIATAINWRVQQEVLNQKAEAITNLSKLMLQEGDPDRVHACVVREAGQMIGCKRALLLLRDTAEEDAFLSVGDWTHGQETPREKPTWFFSIHRHQNPKDGTFGFKRNPEIFQCDDKVLLPNPDRSFLSFYSPNNQDHPEGVLIPLFIKQHENDKHYQPVDLPFIEAAVQRFLNEAIVFLKHYHQIYADRYIKKFVDDEGSFTKDRKEVLSQAAKHLRQCTQCDAVLVYRSTTNGMCVTEVEPDCKELAILPVKPGSLTEVSLQEGRPFRVRDTQDEKDPLTRQMSQDGLEYLAQNMGWGHIKSWYCHPVKSDGQVVGLLKLLTCEKGPYLAQWHEDVVKGIAQSASRQMEQLTREMMLTNLNKISIGLAALNEPDLSEKMAADLTKWSKTILGEQGSVALFASVTSTEVKRFSASQGLPSKFLLQMENVVEDLLEAGEEQKHWEHHDGSFLLARAIDVTGSKALRGAFVFSKGTWFSDSDIFYIKEAVREMSVLLEKERNRHTIRREMSMFRHALIGPVLGLNNAATELYDLMEDKGFEDEAEQFMANVERESEAISLWQRNQRLYMSDELEPIIKNRSFKKLFVQSIMRFESSFKKRGIKIMQKWHPKDGLYMAFDLDGMDLVLSNLLDNALKYGFFNRYVELGVQKLGGWIKIWVENIGHPIPAELKKNIFQPGERLDWSDPIRRIQGTGLGLPMSKKVIDAHGGTIRCESHLAARQPSGPNNIAPHRVKFTIQIPYRRIEEHEQT